MQFNVLATIAAVLCGLLTLLWGVVPDRMLTVWDVAYSLEAGMMARRCACLFAGVGVIFYIARQTPVSKATVGLLTGFAVGCGLLAILGLIEFALHHAGIGLLMSVVGEIAIAILFGLGAIRDAKTLST